MTTFADMLKTAREAAGMTQQAVSDRMKIPKRTIEEWEADRRTPPSYVQRLVLNELADRVRDKNGQK